MAGRAWSPEENPPKKKVGRRRLNPSPETRAAAAYEDFHWGTEPDQIVEARCASPEDGELLVELGKLEEVAYQTAKGGDDAVWVHPFDDPKPVLASTDDGRLVICGGGYGINKRGIVG